MKQTIRIIGGRYRGKKLFFPEMDGLRPTPDRVRETLFNWLMHHIRGAICLDAFAGSGALGLEAFSRGAAEVTFLERAPETYQHLKKSVTYFNNPCLHPIKTDTLLYLKQCKKTFDVVFLDPPFSEQLIPECVQEIKAQGLLKSGGFLYVESDKPLVLDSIQWQEVHIKKAGNVHYGLFSNIN